MIYKFIRPFARIAFKIFFRRIFISQEGNIPLDKPVLMAVNHPTAFIEPCVLACFQPRTLNFLVRGDLWGKKFYDKLLNGVNLIPIYRSKDGFAKMSKNDQTFQFCYDALEEQRTIVLMPEGSTNQKKALRPLKKGLARIAFGALAQTPDLDLKILPVGANFTYADKPREEIMIQFGEPINVLDYKEIYEDNPNRAIRLLTEELASRMQSNIIEIGKEEFTVEIESLLKVLRNELSNQDQYFNVVSNDSNRLFQEKSFAQNADFDENEISDIRMYETMLQKYKLIDRSVQKKANSLLFNGILLLIGLIPSLFGLITNAIPYYFSKYTADNRVRQIEFYSPVFLGTMVVTTLIYYFLWLIAVLWVNNNWLSLVFLLMPICGYFAIVYSERKRLFESHLNYSKLSKSARTELTSQRQKMIEIIKKYTAST